ncbi:MAG: type III secretion system export apparatus subunit SctT [Desulfovibrionales bacterium]|nr:type III secretion system export apparatus subunit SctT [Desulfovibrionales bacterium]
MDIDLLFHQFRVADNILAVLMGLPRLILIMQTVPFMGSSIITGQIRIALAFSVYVFLHPVLMSTITVPDVLTISLVGQYGLIMLKEGLLGFFIGFLAGMLFWAVQSAGFFIDNQRGASMASGADPLSGLETSPLGSFLFQCAVFIFFTGGGFLAFLGLVYASYEVWPVFSLLPMGIFSNSLEIPLYFAGRVAWLVGTMVLLSAPFVAACLLTDMSLGLINRFAAQLNVYILGMPIKSGLAMFLLFISFGVLLLQITGLFDIITHDLYFLERIFNE